MTDNVCDKKNRLIFPRSPHKTENLPKKKDFELNVIETPADDTENLHVFICSVQQAGNT